MIRRALSGFAVAIALAAVSFAAGCGGGGSSSALAPAGHAAGPVSGTQTVSKARVVLKIPASRTTAGKKRSPAYVSTASQGIIIYTYPTLSTPAPSGIAYDLVQTGAGALCSTTPPNGSTPDPSGARYCTLPITAPVGPTTFSAVVYDAEPTGGSGGVGGTIPGSAKVLSRGTVATTIVPFAANTIDFTLNGTVARLSLSPVTIAVGIGSTYTLAVNGLDADGYAIIAPGFYSSATQDQVSIGLEVRNVNTAASAPPVSISTNEITAPGQTVTVTINGDVTNATPAPGITPGIPASIMASVPSDSSIASVSTTLTQGNVTVGVPTPLAYNAGAFVTYDLGSHKVLVYGAGAYVGGSPSPVAAVPVPLPTPVGGSALAYGNGTVYQTTGHGVIDEYTFGWSGNTLVSTSSSLTCVGGCNDVSVALDSASQIYVADVSGSIKVFPAGALGAVSPTYALTGGAALLSYPAFVALDANNYLYVANGNNGSSPYLNVYAPGSRGNTAPLASVQLPVNAVLYGMTITPAGSVFVSGINNSTRTFYHVPVYPNFSQANLVAAGTGDQYAVGSLAADTYGNLLVADYFSQNVSMFAPSMTEFATATVTTGNIEGISAFTIPPQLTDITRRPSSASVEHRR